jgi:hypothetical protein
MDEPGLADIDSAETLARAPARIYQGVFDVEELYQGWERTAEHVRLGGSRQYISELVVDIGIGRRPGHIVFSIILPQSTHMYAHLGSHAQLF